MDSTLRAHMGLLLWAGIVGLSFPAVDMMSEGLPPLLLTAIRFAFAALTLAPMLRRAPDPLPSLHGLALYALMGLCLAGFFGSMFWAAHRTSPLSMATIFVSVPLIAYGVGRSLGAEQRAHGLLGLLILGAVGALGLAWADRMAMAAGRCAGPFDDHFAAVARYSAPRGSRRVEGAGRRPPCITEWPPSRSSNSPSNQLLKRPCL